LQSLALQIMQKPSVEFRKSILERAIRRLLSLLLSAESFCKRAFISFWNVLVPFFLRDEMTTCRKFKFLSEDLPTRRIREFFFFFLCFFFFFFCV
jgi:hypothetical protein